MKKEYISLKDHMPIWQNFLWSCGQKYNKLPDDFRKVTNFSEYVQGIMSCENIHWGFTDQNSGDVVFEDQESLTLFLLKFSTFEE